MHPANMPLPLMKGDAVGVIAPSSSPDKSCLQAGCEVLESWGLRVWPGNYLFHNHESYLAATDDERLEDFQHMIDQPDIRAVYCARGGYGSTRIIDRINFNHFLNHPKWIVGFSDATAIHLKIHRLGVVSIHACMPVQFAETQYAKSVESLRRLLFSSASFHITAKPHSLNKKGHAKGQLIGGNLSLILEALGTPTSLDTEGKILILEDVGEPLYRIDRMITQLKRAGKLNKLAGLILGHFTKLKNTSPPFGETVQEMIIRQTDAFDYPVAFGFPIGHATTNSPWRYSAQATFIVSDNKAAIEF